MTCILYKEHKHNDPNPQLNSGMKIPPLYLKPPMIII